MVSSHDQGLAFERWVYDVLRPYLMRLKSTKFNENPDLHFRLNNHTVLLECKCYEYRINQVKGGSKPGYLSLRQSQIKALRGMMSGLSGENEIYFVVGILFSKYDLMPIVVEFENALKHAKRWSDKQKRKWISMEWMIKQKPLRSWMSELFGVKPEHIQYPEFRPYLRR